MSKQLTDLTGFRFVRWTVNAFHGRNKNLNPMWRCRCDCGTVSVVRGNALTSGKSQSCGCLARDVASERTKTHGLTGSPEWISWQRMKQRCLPKNSVVRKYHAGRGIKICERWLGSFENFLADMGPRPEGKTLERKDNDGNYEPGNCIWATQAEQNNNTRANIFIDFDGQHRTIAQWAKITGIKYITLHARIRRYKMPVDLAMIPCSTRLNNSCAVPKPCANG